MVMLAPESLVIRLMAALTRARVGGCTAWRYVTLEQLTAGSERAWSSSRRAENVQGEGEEGGGDSSSSSSLSSSSSSLSLLSVRRPGRSERSGAAAMLTWAATWACSSSWSERRAWAASSDVGGRLSLKPDGSDSLRYSQ